ncbi:hypothetical protein QF049_000014 [Paenibacillus sp. W4I10]|nr:hypothetical protein [Paenibacillus sp. W4I10]
MKNKGMKDSSAYDDRTYEVRNDNHAERVRLYDQHSFEGMDWPDTEDGRYARAYLEPMMLDGTQSFMSNVETTLLLARIDDLVIPLTVNDTEYDNAYVCSPYTHYVSYAKEELSMLQRPVLEKGLSVLLSLIGWGMKQSQINKVVHVNNWLLSTNLYPAMSGEQVECLLTVVQERYPEHVIVFRSLCPGLHPDLTARLTEAGCRLIPSRQIYLYQAHDPNFGNSKSRWLLKRDYELLAKHDYEFVSESDMTDADIPRIVELYKLLYLEKILLSQSAIHRAVHSCCDGIRNTQALWTAEGRVPGCGDGLFLPKWNHDNAAVWLRHSGAPIRWTIPHVISLSDRAGSRERPPVT